MVQEITKSLAAQFKELTWLGCFGCYLADYWIPKNAKRNVVKILQSLPVTNIKAYTPLRVHITAGQTLDFITDP